jgi:hypothetical protein
LKINYKIKELGGWGGGGDSTEAKNKKFKSSICKFYLALTIDWIVCSSCGLSSLALVLTLLVTFTIKEIARNNKDCVHATMCQFKREKRL